jgi:hypothetical protein
MKIKNAVLPIAFTLCICGTSYLYASSGNYTVYSVFIYNFIKYLVWPQDNEKVTVVVWNNPEAAEELTKMAKAKSTPTREIIVKNISDESGLANAHLLFVPTNSSSAFLKIADKLRSKPIVVVTEEPDLTEKGASMSFKVVSEKIRFQMNNEALRSTGLKVSSTLEALAIK